MIGESTVYGKRESVTTPVPGLNVALSGKLDGGFTPGLLMLAAPSKHFKSAFMLFLASQFLKKYEDGYVLFYDNEFGTPEEYFGSFDVDTSRVIHTPITSVEQFRTDISNQLEGLTAKDNVFIMVDSIGNLASTKEIEDAKSGSDKADMTRAKVLKSTFRIITPHLNIKHIPMVVVNHVYEELALFPKKVVSGGTGAYYSADDIWIIGRRQTTNSQRKVLGYEFIINIEKSRYVAEKSQFAISVKFDGGINRWSGLFEMALEGKYLAKIKKGVYQQCDPETGEVSGPEMSEAKLSTNKEFWVNLITKTKFPSYVKERYAHGNGPILLDEEVMPVD